MQKISAKPASRARIDPHTIELMRFHQEQYGFIPIGYELAQLLQVHKRQALRILKVLRDAGEIVESPNQYAMRYAFKPRKTK